MLHSYEKKKKEEEVNISNMTENLGRTKNVEASVRSDGKGSDEEAGEGEGNVVGRQS